MSVLFLFKTFTFTFLSDQNRLLYNAYNMLELQIPQQEEQNAIQTHREMPEASQKRYIPQ